MNDQASYKFRPATLVDAPALSELGTTTFVEAFGHLYPPDDLRSFLNKAHAASYYERLIRDPEIAIWLAAQDDSPAIGYMVVGLCQLPVPDLEARAGEIRRLYLRKTCQAHGLGTRMLATALDWLASRDFSPLYVGVWSGNVGAQRLYERAGFQKIGEYAFAVGKQLDKEFILKRP